VLFVRVVVIVDQEVFPYTFVNVIDAILQPSKTTSVSDVNFFVITFTTNGVSSDLISKFTLSNTTFHAVIVASEATNSPPYTN
jgi:hypothetical protein